jgi:hypothetical protein
MKPGYDSKGHWCGPASAEVEYWRERAIRAEALLEGEDPDRALLRADMKSGRVKVRYK